MTVPVVFGDIEVALADYLAAELAARGAAVPVVISVPANRPGRFVRLVRVGGSTSNAITDRPRIVFECWDTSGVGAAELGALVRALVKATAPGHVGAVWVDKALDLGFGYVPDPDTNTPRYLVTAELWITGSEL